MDNIILSEMLIVAGGIGLGTGRLIPTAGAAIGLIGVVLGGWALTRYAGRPGSGRLGAVAAGVAGVISVVGGGLHSANSAGGFGTGNGLAGAIVAMVLGLIGLVLSGLALVRSRRLKPDSHPGR